jgi:translation elongation factor EF-Tu-like GTPase
MRFARHIEVEVHYLRAEHGGRSLPCTTGYRPQFFYDGKDGDAEHEYPDVEQVDPGESARAFLTFLSPQQHVGRVHPGMPFLVREGNRVVGYGVVRSLPNLERSAREARPN